MSVFVKLRKLRRMSADEIRQRISKWVVKARERRRWSSKGGERGPVNTFHVDLGASRRFLQRANELVPGACRSEADTIAERFPELHREFSDAIEANAERILERKWRMLGHEFDLTGQLDWHRDVRTGFQWQRTFYADLPLYQLPEDGDVKYPWELSRHQYLFELARHYQFTGSDESAARVCEILLDWIQQNPLYEGVNWTSGLEAGMRAISWIWSLAALESWKGWKEEDLTKIISSCWDHAVYLADNFSYYSSPYNHLIGEAAGLLCLSSLFDECREVQRWREQATRVLLESAPKQFYEDSFCVEQAVGYHYYTLGFLLFARQAMQQDSTSLAKLDEVIHRAASAGKLFRRSDGTWPAVGDLDSARALPVMWDEYWNFEAFHQLAAVACDDSEIGCGGEPSYELVALMGVDGVDRWMELKDSPDGAIPGGAINVQLDESGYLICRDQSDWVLMDVGSISHGLFPDSTPSTAHGHADTLQVLYQHQGVDLLGDGGMPFYGGEPDWVTYFRSPAAHNTVRIDGADFVRRAGRLAWSNEVERPQFDSEFHSDRWLLYGMLNWPGVTHRRYCLCLPGKGLWIADHIECDQVREAEWFWQLPHSDPEFDNRGIVKWGAHSLRFEASSEVLGAAIDLAAPDRPEGWKCLGYGEKSPGCRVSVRATVPNQFVMLTSVGPAERPALAVSINGLTVADTAESEIERIVATHKGCEWGLASAPADCTTSSTG